MMQMVLQQLTITDADVNDITPVTKLTDADDAISVLKTYCNW